MSALTRTMKPRVSAITIGVDDLDKALRFYRDGLGLTTEGIVGQEREHGAVVFFDLSHGVKLALYSRRDIAWDSNIPPEPPSASEFTLGRNVSSRKEVDAVLAQAAAAGAHVTVAAHDTFWGGYAGYFRDPDGHLWEVAWNPSFKIEE